MLAWCSEDNESILWDLTTRQSIGDPITAICAGTMMFSPDGQTLAVHTFHGTVYLLDVTTRQLLGDPLTEYMSMYSDILPLSFSVDGQTLASSERAEIRLWDVATRQPMGVPLGGQHTDWVTSLAFSPNGQMLVSSSGTEIVLWDVATYQSIGDPLRENARSVAFSPDGKILVSSGSTGIVLWDVATRQPLGTLLSEGGTVSNQAFSPDGQMLALKGWDEVIFLDTSVESWKARACRAAGRNMSLNEWQQYMGSEQPYAKTCPDLPIHPDVFIQEGLQLLEAGAVISATQQFSVALQRNPIFDIAADNWNTLCRQGSLQGYAAEVLYACDQAVAQQPEDVELHDSRGVARVLTHDYAGAIEDFTFFVEHVEKSPSMYPSPSMPIDERLAQRRAWIAALERGENPFTDEVLRELRGEE
jgi:hypothetical protein